MMIEQGIHGYCMQETWLLRLFSRKIKGHLLINHGITTNPFHRGHTSSRVAIILGPDLLMACNMAGKPPLITSAINSELPGRIIGVTLCFSNQSNKSLDKYHKRDRGKINIFLASVSYPVDHDDQKRFNEELAVFYNSIPRNVKLLAGQDVNFNIGVQSKILCDVIGTNRIDNCNSKGK